MWTAGGKRCETFAWRHLRKEKVTAATSAMRSAPSRPAASALSERQAKGGIAREPQTVSMAASERATCWTSHFGRWLERSASRSASPLGACAAPSKDLCRAEQVGDLVTRSISGHATEAMQRHYSTVAPEEQRRGLSNVIQLMHPNRAALDGGKGPAVSGEDRKGGRC